jgi:peptidoglycan hydrolase-like protein with peptidoglycan-binding domain
MATDSRGNPILQYNSTGGAVSWLKERLNWWGFYDQAHPDAALGPDIFGWDVAEALVRFQQAYGLNPTGTADASTWAAIEAGIQGISGSQYRGGFLEGPLPTAPYNPTPERTPGGPAAPPENPLNRDALARLGQLLQQYGLGDMLDWVRSKLIAGASEAEIQLELYDQPAFKARFPVIEARRQAGLTPVTAAEVMEYETRGREILRRAGLTQDGFTNKDYLQGLMGKDVSLAEVQDRLNDGLLRVQQAPAEVRNAFGTYFGTQGDVAMAQFFLDPERAVPELEKMASTAMVGGIGERFNVHLAQQIAREVADTGVSDAAVWQGFRQLDSISAVFQESISETNDLTAEGEGVSAIFGTRPGAERALERRVQGRVSQFQGGGGAAAGEAGVIGLGVAEA